LIRGKGVLSVTSIVVLLLSCVEIVREYSVNNASQEEREAAAVEVARIVGRVEGGAAVVTRSTLSFSPLLVMFPPVMSADLGTPGKIR
jgi:hypothetical protein